MIASADPDILQLHGDETPERVIEIHRRWGKPVMKAILVEAAEDAQAALAYRGVADLILFDARAHAAARVPAATARHSIGARF